MLKLSLAEQGEIAKRTENPLPLDGLSCQLFTTAVWYVHPHLAYR